MLRHGALRISSAGLTGTEHLSDVAAVLGGSALQYTERSTPRSQVAATVYTSTDYPADQRIPQHNESSYSTRWPDHLFFLAARDEQLGRNVDVGEAVGDELGDLQFARRQLRLPARVPVRHRQAAQEPGGDLRADQRIALDGGTYPPAEQRETVGLCVIWGVAAALSIGAARYLRSLDSRRRIAVAAERRAQRLTVARDLHDFAAHDVTGVMVLAQAAQALAKDSPERALALLPQIETAGVQALKSMDRTIRIFSELDSGQDGERGSGSERARPATKAAGTDQVSGPDVEGEAGGTEPWGPRPSLRVEEVATLIDRFSSTGTIPARLDLAPGVLDGLPPQVSSVAYRVVMEGLTNVRRHAASASQVIVDLRHTDGADGLRISITDDGAGRPPGVAATEREGGGTGIADLGRRVEALGGTFGAEPRHPVGWRVTAVLPFK